VKAVFLGTPASAVPSLEALVTAGHRVPLVVTQPDRPAGRSSELRPPPVKAAALRLGLPVLQPERIRTPGLLDQVRATDPDLLAVVAYGRILPRPWLEVAPQGAVNVHFSLLPAYRGAAPVQWAIARGETITGVSTMRLSQGLDEGDVLLQREVPVAPGEHAPALLDRLARVGAALLLETLRDLEAGTLVPRPQDPAAATYAPILRREDGEADFSLRALEIEGRIRGFDPWPGVWAAHRGRRLRLVRGRALDDESAEAPPGRIIAFDGEGFRIACGRGTLLRVTAVQPEGRRPLTALEAVNGRHVAPGEDLVGRIATS
jgi:methionyl-tRNA formyltransferase